MGSPARESQCSKEAAISPLVLSWAMPPGGGHLPQLPPGHVAADVLPEVRGDHGVGVRVLALAEQRHHLLLGDILAFQPDQVRATANPAARRVALGGVVGGRIPLALRGRVAVSDMP